MITAPIETTYYYVRNNEIEEETKESEGRFEVKVFEHRPDELWLVLNGGPYSMQINLRSIRDTSQLGWLAQYGTKPVCIDGSWGGRNYPKIMIPHASMRKVWDQVINEFQSQMRALEIGG